MTQKHDLCPKDEPHGPHTFVPIGMPHQVCHGTVPVIVQTPPDYTTAEQELRAAALVAASRAYTGEAPYEGAQPGFAAEVIGLAETYLRWIADGTRPAQPDRGSSL